VVRQQRAEGAKGSDGARKRGAYAVCSAALIFAFYGHAASVAYATWLLFLPFTVRRMHGLIRHVPPSAQNNAPRVATPTHDIDFVAFRFFLRDSHFRRQRQADIS
jgi:hypothetical protein